MVFNIQASKDDTFQNQKTRYKVLAATLSYVASGIHLTLPNLAFFKSKWRE